MDTMLLPVQPAELIASSRDAIDAIKTAAGLTDSQFAALCMPMIRTYAEHVQNLPLTASAFGSPRGAWEFGLTATMVAYRYAGTVVFYPSLGSEERRLLEPQCRYMAFVATLSSALAIVTESGILVSGDDVYHPLSVADNLFNWLSTHRGSQFKWRSPVAPISPQAGAAIAAHFVPRRLLTNFDLRAVLMMYDAINPQKTTNGVESTLARVVRQAIQGVLDHHKSKQAGTFQTEPIQQRVSVMEAEGVAKKMIAVANPTILVNPLEMQTTAATTDTNESAPLASSTVHLDSKTEPASGPRSSHRVSTDSAADGTSIPTEKNSAQQPLSLSDEDALEKLARSHKVLREWFNALKQHAQFPVLKDQLVMDDKGIEVPVSMLGMFGVSGASIRKMMDDAGLILRRSENARGIILHPGLRNHFISQ